MSRRGLPLAIAALWSAAAAAQDVRAPGPAVELDRLVPRSEISMDMSMALAVSAQGQSERMAMSIRNETAIAPAPAGAE